MDIAGKLVTTLSGNGHILVMQDDFSKYFMAIAMPNVKTTTVAYVIAVNLFSLCGAPKCILMDRSSSFISDLMKKKAGQVVTFGNTWVWTSN